MLHLKVLLENQQPSFDIKEIQQHIQECLNEADLDGGKLIGLTKQLHLDLSSIYHPFFLKFLAPLFMPLPDLILLMASYLGYVGDLLIMLPDEEDADEPPSLTYRLEHLSVESSHVKIFNPIQAEQTFGNDVYLLVQILSQLEKQLFPNKV